MEYVLGAETCKSGFSQDVAKVEYTCAGRYTATGLTTARGTFTRSCENSGLLEDLVPRVGLCQHV